MRVLVTGATGNVGTSVIERLLSDPQIEEIVGVARRKPVGAFPRVRWVTADISKDDLTDHLQGIDAVIHLAWQLQPSHDVQALAQTNVMGGRRVCEASARAGVPALLVASSVGAYAPAPRDERQDESWSTAGIPSSSYSRQKAALERALDLLEMRYRNLRLVRFRPALIFKREAAGDILRLFLGPWVPRRIFDPRWCPAVPKSPDLRFQCVHSLDVGEAFRLALHREVRGAFNLAAEPVIDSRVLAELLHARRVPVSPKVLRALTALGWHLGILKSEPGWIDLAFSVPLMSCERAHRELGWAPLARADAALKDLLDGIVSGAGMDTPPLQPRTGRERFAASDPSMEREHAPPPF